MPLRTKKKKTITFNKRSKKLVGGKGGGGEKYSRSQKRAYQAQKKQVKLRKALKEQVQKAQEPEPAQKAQEPEPAQKAQEPEQEPKPENFKQNFDEKLKLLTDSYKIMSEPYLIGETGISNCQSICSKKYKGGTKENISKRLEEYFKKAKKVEEAEQKYQKTYPNSTITLGPNDKKQDLTTLLQFYDKINDYLNTSYLKTDSFPKSTFDITQLLINNQKSNLVESLKETCYKVTNFILYSYFDKLQKKIKMKKEKSNFKSVKMGDNYKLCIDPSERQKKCEKTLFNMLYLEIPNMLTINLKKINDEFNLKITEEVFWETFIYDPDTIKTLYETTRLMLKYHKKINSTEAWAKAWYQQKQNPADRTLENFKQNQLDTLFTEQYKIVYGLPLHQEKKKELQQIQENIEKYHNVHAISILNHLLIFSTDEVSCKQIDVSELEGQYLNLINVCN